MNVVHIIIILFISTAISGYSFTYPQIPLSGQSIASFVPRGWSVLDSATGDLNADKLNDIALVLQHNDSVVIIKHADDYSDTVLTQPRMLVVVLYNSTTKQYHVAEQSTTFILHHDNPVMDDPFSEISIRHGVLCLDFTIFYSMGTWTTSHHLYKFRFQADEFRLIGAEYNSLHRGSGETEDRSYNFLTNRVKITSGDISTEKHRTRMRAIYSKKLQTFKTFRTPFTYEVEKDFFI